MVKYHIWGIIVKEGLVLSPWKLVGIVLSKYKTCLERIIRKGGLRWQVTNLFCTTFVQGAILIILGKAKGSNCKYRIHIFFVSWYIFLFLLLSLFQWHWFTAPQKVLQLPTISGSIEVWDFLSVDSQVAVSLL